MKSSKVIAQQTKTIENPNIVDIKSTVVKHSKTSQKLSKTIKDAEKASGDSSLYSETKKSENILDEEM